MWAQCIHPCTPHIRTTTTSSSTSPTLSANRHYYAHSKQTRPTVSQYNGGCTAFKFECTHAIEGRTCQPRAAAALSHRQTTVSRCISKTCQVSTRYSVPHVLRTGCSYETSQMHVQCATLLACIPVSIALRLLWKLHSVLCERMQVDLRGKVAVVTGKPRNLFRDSQDLGFKVRV